MSRFALQIRLPGNGAPNTAVEKWLMHHCWACVLRTVAAFCNDCLLIFFFSHTKKRDLNSIFVIVRRPSQSIARQRVRWTVWLGDGLPGGCWLIVQRRCMLWNRVAYTYVLYSRTIWSKEFVAESNTMLSVQEQYREWTRAEKLSGSAIWKLILNDSNFLHGDRAVGQAVIWGCEVYFLFSKVFSQESFHCIFGSKILQDVRLFDMPRLFRCDFKQNWSASTLVIQVGTLTLRGINCWTVRFFCICQVSTTFSLHATLSTLWPIAHRWIAMPSSPLASRTVASCRTDLRARWVATLYGFSQVMISSLAFPVWHWICSSFSTFYWIFASPRLSPCLTALRAELGEASLNFGRLPTMYLFWDSLKSLMWDCPPHHTLLYPRGLGSCLCSPSLLFTLFADGINLTHCTVLVMVILFKKMDFVIFPLFLSWWLKISFFHRESCRSQDALCNGSTEL